MRLSNLLGAPLVHTGALPGPGQAQALLARGISREGDCPQIHIDRRIDAEESVLASADLVVTSTHNEIEQQYGLYNYYDPGRMVVIPPGTDLQQFHPAQPGEQFLQCRGGPLPDGARQAAGPGAVAGRRAQEYRRPDRGVRRITALQDAANLLIVAGNRADIRDLDTGSQAVLTDLLLVLDAYDLYGRVALPKHHRPEDVPQIYRMVAAGRGVFINPALTEPWPDPAGGGGQRTAAGRHGERRPGGHYR
ncbi:MAG: hypothetical protein R3E50_07180 [Halioglobus sp.]